MKPKILNAKKIMKKMMFDILHKISFDATMVAYKRMKKDGL